MRIIFFVGNHKNERGLRLVQEAKEMGIETLWVNSYTCQIGVEKIIKDSGQQIKIRRDDVFWMTSGALINQFISRFLDRFNNFSWFNSRVVDFSNKYFCNAFFSRNQIDTPNTFLINYLGGKNLKKIVNLLGGFPLVIKNNQGSHGHLVAKVEKINDVKEFIQKTITNKIAPTKSPFRFYSFILQEFITESVGTDFRVLCLEDRVIGGIKRVSQNGDFRANISLGGKAEFFDVPTELAKICQKIMREGNLFYAGLDFIKSKRGWLAVEVNTSAEFKGFESATGINVAREIVKALMKKQH